MKEIKFSIIIYSQNEKGLKETLDSVWNQEFNNYEIVIIDLSLDNNVKKIIEKYKNILGNRMHWMSLAGKNIIEAMNEGAKMARGEYLCMLESGDTLEKNVLGLASKSAQKYPQADVVYEMKSVWDLNKEKRGLLNSRAESFPAKSGKSFKIYYKKDLHRQFGFYVWEDKIVEDYAFCLKAFYLGQAIVRPFDLVTENNQIAISNNQ